MKLVKEKKATPLSFEDMINVINTDFANVQVMGINMRDLEIHDDFSITSPAGQLPVTRTAILSLCKQLGIPDPFAVSIPEDLLLYNIRRLLNERATKEASLVYDPEDRLIGFSNSAPAKIINLKKFGDEFPLGSLLGAEPRFILLHDQYVRIDWINNEWEQLHPKVGDISATGISLHTGLLSSMVFANPYLMQLVCSNGAVLPKTMGAFHMNNNVSDTRYQTFFAKLSQNFIRMELLKDSYDFINTRKFNTARFRHFWNGLQKILNDANDTDSLFGVDVDERKYYFSSYETSKTEAVELRITPTFEETNINYYKTYYDITDYAKKVDSVLTQRELTILAGKFLNDYSRN